MKQNKIVFILPFLTQMDRGIERSGSNLALALASKGLDISILYWKTKNKPLKKLQGIAYFGLSLPRYYKRRIVPIYYFFWFLMNKPRTVIIYYANHGEAAAFKWLKKLFRFHLSFIVGYPIEIVKARFDDFNRLGLSNHLDSIIVKSPAMVNGIADFFNRRIDMVTNGIDLNYFKHSGNASKRQEIRNRYHIPSDAKVLITVAAFEKRKGMHLVMQSMERLALRGHQNVYYILLGDGPMRSFFEEAKAATALADKIIFAGSHREVLPFYEAADLFILPSYGEGFPNVMLEAWAMKLPVIVSDADPYPGITTPEIAQMLPLAQPELLDEWLMSWMNGDAKWTEMAEKAFEHVHQHYAWPVVAERYAKIWEKGFLDKE